MDDIEKKNLLSYLIKRIDIYANDEGTTQVLKSIEFNFPIYKDGTFVRKILLDERVNVEGKTVCVSPQITAFRRQQLAEKRVNRYAKYLVKA